MTDFQRELKLLIDGKIPFKVDYTDKVYNKGVLLLQSEQKLIQLTHYNFEYYYVWSTGKFLMRKAI